MKKLLIVAMSLGLVGCATLPHDVREQVKVGMTGDDVEAVLGKPQAFTNATMTYYQRYDTCLISFEYGYVKEVACQHDQQAEQTNRRQAMSAFGRAFQPLPPAQNYSQNIPTSCTTRMIGNQAHTQCY